MKSVSDFRILKKLVCRWIQIVLAASFCASFSSRAQTCVPAPAGIVSWWQGESNTLDSASQNNGFFIGSLGFASGKLGSAFKFNGTNQFVTVSDAPNLHFSNAMTLEAWVFPTAYSGNTSSVLCKYDSVGGVNQSAWYLGIDGNGLGFITISTNGRTGTMITATNSCPLNIWTHLAASYDGTNAIVYINGAQSISVPFRGTIFPGTDNLAIGACVGGGADDQAVVLFSGMIDEPAVYNRTLSPIEIQNIYNAGSNGKCVIPLHFTAQPTNQTVYINQSPAFAVTATGAQPITYQWFFNGTNLSGATNSSLHFTHVQFDQAGTYYATVSNAATNVPLASSNVILAVLPPPPCLTASSNIVSWWKAENNALDYAGIYNGTLVGAPTFAPGKVGQAFNFNGSNQYVVMPSLPNLELSNALTFEAWIQPTAYNTNTSVILCKFISATTGGYYNWSFFIGGDGRGGVRLNSAGNTYVTYSTNVCPLGTWSHLAATLDGTNLAIYLNGVKEASTPMAEAIETTFFTVCIGGNLWGPPASLFTGLIDEPAIYNRALSLAEIHAIYNIGSFGKCPIAPHILQQPANTSVIVTRQTNFSVVAVGDQPMNYQWSFNGTNINGATNSSLTLANVQFNQAGTYSVTVSNAAIIDPVSSSNATLTVLPTPPCVLAPSNLVSWWPAEGNALDYAATNNGTLHGSSAFSGGIVGQAFYLDGNYFRVSDSPSLHFSNAITVEAWVYVYLYNNGDSPILSKYSAPGASNPQSSWLLNMGTEGLVSFSASTDGTNTAGRVYTPNVCPLQSWTHLAATYDGSALKIYVNGVLQGSVPMSGNLFPGNQDLGIGASVGGSANSVAYGNMVGKIDEAAVYSRALSGAEILSLATADVYGKCSAPIVPVIQPTNQTSPAGGAVIFSASVTSLFPVAYQWSLNGTNIEGATNSVLTLLNIQPIQAGAYRISVSNLATAAPGISSAATLAVLPPPPCFAISSNLVSWWSAESNALDCVGTNNGTFIGSTDYPAGRIGRSFDISGSFVHIPDSPGLHFSNSMTLEAWIFPTAYNVNGGAILSKADGLFGRHQASWELSLNNDRRGGISLSTNGGISATQAYSTSTCPLNTWTHLAATYDGLNLKLYWNGIPQSSVPMTGTIFPGSDDVAIGANIGGVSDDQVLPSFSGLVDEPAIYNRALAADEIQAIYISGKCVPPPVILSQPADASVYVTYPAQFNVFAVGSQPLTYQWSLNGSNLSGATSASLLLTNTQFAQGGVYSVTISNPATGLFVKSSNANLTVSPIPGCAPVSNLVSWWAAESNAFDNLGGNTGTLIGSPAFGAGKSGLAFMFSGSNQFVRIPDAPNLHLSNALTLEAWVFPIAYNPNSAAVLCKVDAVGGVHQSAWYFGIDGSGRAFMNISTNGSNNSGASSSKNCPLNTWTHLATTYNGTNLIIYFNGVPDVSVPLTGNIFPGTDDLAIGACVGGAVNNQAIVFFSGMIDEPAVYNRALSAGEILAICNADLSGKCTVSLSKPVVYSQPTNVTVVAGGKATLSPAVIGSPILNYQWQFNGSNIPGATDRVLSITNVQPANSGNYALLVGNTVNSALSSNAFLTVGLATVLGNNKPLTNAQYSFTNSVSIKMTNFYTDGAIYYTLDGSAPTTRSMAYTNIFVISNSCTIRALGCSPDFLQAILTLPVAIQIIPTFTLTTSAAGGGQILLSPQSSFYLSNAVVSAGAFALSGWSLFQWLGDASGTNHISTMVMNRNKSVQAVFGTTVTALPVPGGSGGGFVQLNPPGGRYSFGTTIQASAIPSPGNVFLQWNIGLSGTTNPSAYSVVNPNRTLSALFTNLGSGQSALTIVPVGHGTVSVNPLGNMYTTGSSVSITAAPDTNKFFLGWSGDASGTNNPLLVVLDQSETIYANFTTNNSLLVYPITSPGLGGGMALDLVGEIGTHYRVDASSNLLTWTNLYNLTNSVGTIHYIDQSATNSSDRFYKAIVLP